MHFDQVTVNGVNSNDIILIYGDLLFQDYQIAEKTGKC